MKFILTITSAVILACPFARGELSVTQKRADIICSNLFVKISISRIDQRIWMSGAPTFMDRELKVAPFTGSLPGILKIKAVAEDPSVDSRDIYYDLTIYGNGIPPHMNLSMGVVINGQAGATLACQPVQIKVH